MRKKGEEVEKGEMKKGAPKPREAEFSVAPPCLGTPCSQGAARTTPSLGEGGSVYQQSSFMALMGLPEKCAQTD